MPLAERFLWTLIPLGGLALLLFQLLAAPLPWAFSAEWIPALNAHLDVRIDGLSALMLLMILGVGSAVFIYAGGYLDGHPQQRRAYVLLSLFATAMVGCVSANNVLQLFMFWELTSLLSFLLVGFNHEDEAARKSAQQAMLITGAGGLAMLGGIVMLGQLTGTWRISDIVAQLPHLPASPTFYTAIGLIMVGAFTKSAQFPFHFWLPDAMSAPTPASAYLHSATMVKLGVYLLARLDAGMDAWPWWQNSLQIAGAFTAAWGIVLALREFDLKRILAWSTVATLGTLVFIVGMPGYAASVAVAALLLAHAMYKATLFFVAGNVDHGTGTRDFRSLGLLRKYMPFTAAAALLGGLSMAGLPGTFGFIAKEALIQAKANTPYLAAGGWANTLFTAIGIAVAATIAVRIFWQQRNTQTLPDHPHEGGLGLVFPPLLLASAGLVAGLFPTVAQGLIQQAAAAMHPDVPQPAAQLALNGGVIASALPSLALYMGLGVAVFVLWERLRPIMDAVVRPLPTGSGIFRTLLKGLPWVAATTNRCLQNGRLVSYHAMLVGGIMLGLFITMLTSHSWALPGWELPSPGALLGCALIIAGAVLAIFMHHRFLLVLTSGLVGYGSAILYLFTGAPDLAFTQFSVETVLVMVIAAILLLLRLDGYPPDSTVAGDRRPSRLIIALLTATAITGLLLAVTAQPFNTILSDYFGQHSLPDAHGRNVVNVILVDFRGFDTFGEISVIFLTLLSSLPLLAAMRHRVGQRKLLKGAAHTTPAAPREGDAS